MAARVGFSATISRESRQARKGATVTVISGAGEVPARAVSSCHGGFLAFQTLVHPLHQSLVLSGLENTADDPIPACSIRRSIALPDGRQNSIGQYLERLIRELRVVVRTCENHHEIQVRQYKNEIPAIARREEAVHRLGAATEGTLPP